MRFGGGVGGLGAGNLHVLPLAAAPVDDRDCVRAGRWGCGHRRAVISIRSLTACFLGMGLTTLSRARIGARHIRMQVGRHHDHWLSTQRGLGKQEPSEKSKREAGEGAGGDPRPPYQGHRDPFVVAIVPASVASTTEAERSAKVVDQGHSPRESPIDPTLASVVVNSSFTGLSGGQSEMSGAAQRPPHQGN